MNLYIISACILAVAEASHGGLGWNFWGRFNPPWEFFYRSSYDMKKALDLTDTNNDGFISLQEIRDDASRFDANGDGRVTRCEYVRYNVENIGARLDVINNNFDNIDRNGDNYLTTEDADLFAPFIPFIDLNNDSKLDREEMIKAFRQGDKEGIEKAECEPYYLYRLPPRELMIKKSKCAMMKRH